jgi:hypothetical protein
VLTFADSGRTNERLPQRKQRIYIMAMNEHKKSYDEAVLFEPFDGDFETRLKEAGRLPNGRPDGLEEVFKANEESIMAETIESALFSAALVMKKVN